MKVINTYIVYDAERGQYRVIYECEGHKFFDADSSGFNTTDPLNPDEAMKLIGQ